MELPIICAVTCTRGRHSLLERCVGMYLAQDYKGKSYQLIFNNSPVEQELAEGLPKNIILVNSSKEYSSIDQIFSDAMKHIPEDVEVVTFFDDDDIFLENHLSEGAEGYMEARFLGKQGYKPYYSLIDTESGRAKQHNMCEPSFFVSKDWINKYGFSSHSAAYHHQWANPLIFTDMLHEPEHGEPTFVYQWVGGCYHISGDGEDPDNLKNHNNNSTDEGDGIITPMDI